MEQRNRVSVIGTGRMGSALASAFAKAGVPTTVWNRTRTKTARLAALGARVADTVASAVQAADIVVVNVIDYEASDRLLRTDEAAQALRGRILVQTTSGSPKLARAAGEWASEHDVAYLDAAIMATPDFIGHDGVTILYGGPAAVFARAEAVLRALGGTPVHVGDDVGHASALDSALLSTMWGGLFGTLVGAAVCEAEGIALATYRAHATAVAPMMIAATDDVIGRVQARRFAGDETTLASLEAHFTAFRHLVELCDAHGIDPSVNGGFDRLFRAAIDRGHAPDDFAQLYTLVRPGAA
jgi:3-hydroxyisobutyrate dehydrogenase-like beta-hydroxyacid dehydrogenase